MRYGIVLLTVFILFINSITFSQQVKEGTIKVNDVSLYYKTIGSGEPIIILHGGPGLDHTYLLPQFERLARNHTLVFYDQRASGRSTGVVDSVSMSPKQFVEDLEAVRKAMKIEKMNLLGHSWGALLAMHYASFYPEKLKSLILLNTPGPTSEYLQDFAVQRTLRTTHQDSLDYRRILTSNEFAEAKPVAMEEYIRTVFRAYFLDRKNVDQITISFNTQTAKNILPIFYMSLKFYPFDLRPQLAALKCPTLILQGDYDVILPKYAEEVHRLIPKSEFVIFKNCGHFPYIEKPDEFFSTVTDFLRKSER